MKWKFGIFIWAIFMLNVIHYNLYPSRQKSQIYWYLQLFPIIWEGLVWVELSLPISVLFPGYSFAFFHLPTVKELKRDKWPGKLDWLISQININTRVIICSLKNGCITFQKTTKYSSIYFFLQWRHSKLYHIKNSNLSQYITKKNGKKRSRMKQ